VEISPLDHSYRLL